VSARLALVASGDVSAETPPLPRRSSAARPGSADQAIATSRRAHTPAGHLASAFAAKRSPAGDGALTNPAAKALVAVLSAVSECDRESPHESVAVPFVPAA
jgi:hypothetical protein